MQAAREKYLLEPTGDPLAEIEFLRGRLDAGDEDAALTLGLLLAYGGDSFADPTAAAALFQRAAARGNPRASAELGRLYLSGYGVPADAASAMRLFTAALAGGDAEGGFLLATGHRLNLFPESNPELAIGLLSEVAEAGHIAAANAIHRLLDEHEIDGVDTAKLIGWLQAGAEAGDVTSMLNLASIYRRNGEPERAFAVLETAAETGSYDALMPLLSLSGLNPAQPEARARMIEILQQHVAEPERAPAGAFVMLALLHSLDRDRETALSQSRFYLEEAARRREYAASVALHHMDAGASLFEALLHASALSREEAYIKQWHFESGRRNGQPAAFRMRQPFRFTPSQ